MARNNKKEKHKKKNKKIILVLLAILFISSAGFIFYNSSYNIAATKEAEMFIFVGENIGFDVNESYVHFGLVRPGGISEKTVNVSNFYEMPLKVYIRLTGDFSKWISIGENNFILQKDESRLVKLQANVPKGAEFGNYTGKILVIFRRT